MAKKDFQPRNPSAGVGLAPARQLEFEYEIEKIPRDFSFLVQRFRTIRQRIASDYWLMGQTCWLIRDMHFKGEISGFEQFGDICKQEIGLSRTAVYSLISIYQIFRFNQLENLELDLTRLNMLAGVKDESLRSALIDVAKDNKRELRTEDIHQARNLDHPGTTRMDIQDFQKSLHATEGERKARHLEKAAAAVAERMQVIDAKGFEIKAPPKPDGKPGPKPAPFREPVAVTDRQISKMLPEVRALLEDYARKPEFQDVNMLLKRISDRVSDLKAAIRLGDSKIRSYIVELTAVMIQMGAISGSLD